VEHDALGREPQHRALLFVEHLHDGGVTRSPCAREMHR
jgi:hypothetical protein